MSLAPDIRDAIQAVVGPRGVIEPGPDMIPYLVEERAMWQGACELVVRPSTSEEVSRIVSICAARSVPIVPLGGNTGLVGGGVAQGGIIVSLGRMNQIRALDAANHTLTVEAGCVLANLQAAAEDADCLFPLSLAAEGTCQIGGNLSTNAGGVQVLRYGNARDLTLGLEVVLADGRIWDGLRGLRKDNTGYDLKQLFIGAEGTLGIITAAVLKLYPKSHDRATALVASTGVGPAMALFQRIRDACGDSLTACELIDDNSLEFVLRNIPGTRAPCAERHPYYVLIELTNPRPAAALGAALEQVLADAFEDGIIVDAAIATSESQAQEFWHIRESMPEAQKPEGASIKHDIAVPISRVADYVEQAIASVTDAIPGVRPVVFGHLGDGNVHFNLSQPEGADPAKFLTQRGEINRIVYDLSAQMNGSFSAEHGVGLLKRDEMMHYKDEVETDLMRSLKRALDPNNIMNPGKIV
jgi:FAD/FMN-containing dehydrogenase